MCNLEHCSFQLCTLLPKNLRGSGNHRPLENIPVVYKFHNPVSFAPRHKLELPAILSNVELSGKVFPLIKSRRGSLKKEVTSCCQDVSLSYLHRSGAKFERHRCLPRISSNMAFLEHLPRKLVEYLATWYVQNSNLWKAALPLLRSLNSQNRRIAPTL